MGPRFLIKKKKVGFVTTGESGFYNAFSKWNLLTEKLEVYDTVLASEQILAIADVRCNAGCPNIFVLHFRCCCGGVVRSIVPFKKHLHRIRLQHRD